MQTNDEGNALSGTIHLDDGSKFRVKWDRLDSYYSRSFSGATHVDTHITEALLPTGTFADWQEDYNAAMETLEFGETIPAPAPATLGESWHEEYNRVMDEVESI